MLAPSMLSMADVMADSGYTEEAVFDCGISGQIVFLVVVPLVGACRVPIEALSHFMAGADDYTTEGMPEHWSGAPSGKWTIKRDRLRIFGSSWNIFSDDCDKLAEAWAAATLAPAIDDGLDLTLAEQYKRNARFNIAAGRCSLHEAAEILNIDTKDSHKSILETIEAAAKSGLLPVYARGQRNRYVYEEYARVSVFDTEVFCDELDKWLEANEPKVKYRFSVPLEVAPITTPAQHTATVAPVVPAKRREKKPSIETVALDYMRAEFRQGQFQSAAKFHKHLIRTAGLNNSPFEMGTGTNARKLFCPAASSFYDAGTLGKSWAKIRAV